MGSRINPEITRLIAERKLMSAQIGEGMIIKEVEAAQTDLQDAQDSLQNNKFKWATIQGYYSMFHSARALLFSKRLCAGFRFRSTTASRKHYSKSLFALRKELNPRKLSLSCRDFLSVTTHRTCLRWKIALLKHSV